MKSATRILREEHDAILGMLDALEAAAHRAEAGHPIPPHILTDLQEFFTLFADRCHHGKEEELLFPLLERKGVPNAGGPLHCMLTEHDDGRALVKAMAANAEGCTNGDSSARMAWAQAARGYANLLRNHIWKENEILFRLAERLMSTEEQAELAEQFTKVEEQKMGPGTHARLHSNMRRLVQEMVATAK